jgi:PTH2 family peptidyl-tRNA hydrolase
MGEIKQVLVVRNDLGIRKGKMVAQGSHASMAFMAQRWLRGQEPNPTQRRWLEEGQAKICVRADSEEHLLQIQQQALNRGLTCHLITDAGHTEFNGIPTKTCLAIGPNKSDEIDVVTGELKLL